MGTDDPSSLGLAEKKQKSGKPACRVFLSCPIRAANAPVPIPFLSVFIWVIRGYLKLSLCLCGLVRGGLRFQVSAGFNLGGHGETEKRAV
jgi:hypothetical protein